MPLYFFILNCCMIIIFCCRTHAFIALYMSDVIINCPSFHHYYELIETSHLLLI